MKVAFFTIVLDGMPYISWHLPMMNKLSLDWEWHVVEGVARPTHCTKWCKTIDARLSVDGTREYLDEIVSHKRVHVHKRPLWDGKIQMVNVVAEHIKEKTLVIQIDSDEIWTAGQIETIHQLLSTRANNSALFTCRYFVGQDIAALGRGGYGNRGGEWMRAFVMSPGMRFSSHEPPRIAGVTLNPIMPDVTESYGLVFDHYAYATRKSVAFKEKYYGYKDAVACWERLQMNHVWPAKLKNFFPWVRDESVVEKIK